MNGSEQSALFRSSPRPIAGALSEPRFGTPKLENPPQNRRPLSPSPHFKIGDNRGHTDSNRRRGGKREQPTVHIMGDAEVIHFQRLIDLVQLPLL
jgi:hypothetical protein